MGHILCCRPISFHRQRLLLKMFFILNFFKVCAQCISISSCIAISSTGKRPQRSCCWKICLGPYFWLVHLDHSAAETLQALSRLASHITFCLCALKLELGFASETSARHTHALLLNTTCSSLHSSEAARRKDVICL